MEREVEQMVDAFWARENEVGATEASRELARRVLEAERAAKAEAQLANEYHGVLREAELDIDAGESNEALRRIRAALGSSA